MATFTGTIAEFHKYIGPMIRNHIQYITRKHKKELGYICQHCKEKKVLDAAHIDGKKRRTLINNVLNRYLTDEVIIINIQDIINQIMEEHQPIESCFLFICHKCHFIYDEKSDKSLEIPEESAVPNVVNLAMK